MKYPALSVSRYKNGKKITYVCGYVLLFQYKCYYSSKELQSE